MISHTFEDAHQISDRDHLGQQVLQDALNLPDVQKVRHEFVDQCRVIVLQGVDQHLHILTSQNLIGVTSNRFTQVRDHHGGCIHNRVAGHLSVSPLYFIHPGRRQLEYRFGGWNTLKHDCTVRGVHGHPMAGHDFARSDHLPSQQELILVGAKLKTVTQTDGWHDETHVLRK